MTAINSDLEIELEEAKETQIIIKKTVKAFDKKQQKVKDENWLKTSLNKVLEDTKGISNSDELSNKVLSIIAHTIHAGIGNIYVLQRSTKTKEERNYKLSASFATPFSKQTKLVKYGEGIIGQIAQNMTPIELYDIPEGYFPISSGSGEAKPSVIYAFPIYHEQKVIAIVELGLFKELSILQIEFLKELSLSTGILFNSVLEQEKSEILSIEVNNQIQAINLSNAVIEFDLNGNILYANEMFLNLMEYKLEEIKGKHHSIFLTTDISQTPEYQTFWASLRKGEFKNGEFKRKGNYNKTIWIQGSYNPLKDKNGNPYKVMKIAIDITEQKRQQALSDQLSLEFNNQMNAVNRSNATIEFDLSGHILKTNEHFNELFEYEEEELVGKHHSMFVSETDKNSDAYLQFWSDLNNGKYLTGEFNRVGKNGKNIWINGSYNPLFDANNKPYKILKIATDITSKKEDEFEMIRQKEELAAQEEEMRIFNKELKLQTEKLTASEEELRIQQQELAEANSKLEEKSQELEANHKLVVEKNKDLEQAKIVLDLKAKELESSSKFKSEFLANMSHELRTPLNSILILSKLLSTNKGDNLTEKQIEFASVINKSGTDLLKLINEVLDLAKVESGKIELEIKEHKIDQFAKDMSDTFMALSKENKIQFNVKCSPNLPETFVSDAHRLSQIVKNLLSNAFKFTSAEGRIDLSFNSIKSKPEFTSPQLLKQEDVLEIAVRDSGIGIEKSKLESVFEAFKQADGSTQRKYGGTGLGLSISKELVHLLGGQISLESELGKGTTFFVHIPFETKVEENERTIVKKEVDLKPQFTSDSIKLEDTEIQPASNFEPIIADDRLDFKDSLQNVLIVEDDLQFAKVLLNFAREKGFKGIVANQGDMALSYVEHFRPKAIILDMQLPVMDGWTVLKKLKASKHATIPIHVISGIDKKDLGIQLGAINYMVKPISEEALSKTFKSLEDTIGDSIKNILIIEDNSAQNIAIRELVASKQLNSSSAHSGKQALKKLKTEKFDMLILDLGLPDMNGIEVLHKVREKNNSIPVIIFTGKELSKEELKSIEKYKDTSVVLKSDNAYDRLLEETELFIHHVNKPENQPKKDAPIPTVESSDLTEELGGKKILIVDDDMRNIYSLQVALEGEGVDTKIATNGQEAVDLIKDGSDFDVVLMDIMMPVMDGYEATRQIRADGKKDLPIIALTAKAMKGDREKCLNAGASDYLSKPIDMDKLLSLLKVWVN